MALLYCYYGDDFTGSTDVLEQLAGNGVSSVLFLGAPTEAQLARFSACQAIGFAGDARSRTPEWMSGNLPAIFNRMRGLKPAVVQYKVCSTFDSAPHRGSIGRALEIGREVFATPTVPIGVAAPHLGRFLLFGNLFAAGGRQVYRIDRHPTMAHHPATPMDEADLRLHLAKQTNLAVGLVDLRAFQTGDAEEQFHQQAEGGAAAVLLDGVDDAMLQKTGELIWGLAMASQPVFTIGSSGVTASLISHWRSAGIIASEPPSVTATKADQILVISGSCSAVTEGQILWAKQQGFACLELDAAALAHGGPGAVETAVGLALKPLRSGQDTVLYTALGTPKGSTHDKELGLALGRLMLALVQQTGVRRVVLCGGDTSSHAVQQLGLTALTFAGTLAPGAPLCRAHAEEATGLDGLELVLKGGQIGPEDFFRIARYGNGGCQEGATR
jgi:3-oxoisoapionate kinase